MADLTYPAMENAAQGLAAQRRSLVVPVYRNEENIDDLVLALNGLNVRVRDLEVIFVIDGSPDRSGELLLAKRSLMQFHAKFIFHSRNFGAFTAIRTGMEMADGEMVAIMAADLQEPPELIESLFQLLEEGRADVVFGQRTGRNDSAIRDFLSNCFWSLYRKLVIPEVPKGGVDIFGCNRQVANTVLQIEEPNSSLVAQLFWVGFRRDFVPYERRRRQKGEGSWSFSRRVRYMMDSIFSFSDLPILFVLWFGVIGCLISLATGLAIALARLTGIVSEPGYAALAVLITFTASASLAVQGILGSYLWRTFENTKRRPLRIIARNVSHQPPPTSSE